MNSTGLIQKDYNLSAGIKIRKTKVKLRRLHQLADYLVHFRYVVRKVKT